ncbi:GNAT family N-acetyltransferase [Amycolatopsis sp. CA-230715]|uniref:GNAT family N-acetyltransferase n=1 Tax=Amycolatopsis sp. CA-230715 TaxID=2745196 RepID=UPI001C01DBE2|nr:GNAT family protein [Amycolatopsis sp. CA-230715]QWF81392.1 hypothetical protein HUW46_04823 [Amycolatopsis sp. CA-230715]
MTDWTTVPTLTGEHVRLEPLSGDHAEGLHEAGRDPEIWAWLSLKRPETLDDTRAMVETIRSTPGRQAFAQIDAVTGEVAGTTSYYQVDPAHRALLIGYTWIGKRWQRTPLNTEAKLLLLTHAFEARGAIRVAWQTDHRNERSQRAIERLGAKRDGVLRSHRIRPDGTVRDTVEYSVIAAEWPSVRDGLLARLG